MRASSKGTQFNRPFWDKPIPDKICFNDINAHVEGRQNCYVQQQRSAMNRPLSIDSSYADGSWSLYFEQFEVLSPNWLNPSLLRIIGFMAL